MRDLLEGLIPFEQPTEESYRHYGIGLAAEALAYGEERLPVSAQFLELAEIHYRLAVGLNQEEKYFVEAQKRAFEALQNVWQILRRPDLGLAPSRRSTSIVGTGVVRPLTNAVVIELVKAGLNEENLLWLIKNQREGQFDLSPQGLKHLLDNKVSNAVIGAMRELQKRTKEPSAQPRRKPPSTFL
jgi:hypothetical protein